MAANPSIQLGTDGNWAIKEDNLLAYKKDGTRFFNKEFDFTRGSLATFVDKDGLIKVSGVTDTELVVNGDFATDSDWSEAGSVEILNGSANFTITSGSFAKISQNISLTNSKTYKLTLQVLGDNSGSNIYVRDTATGDNGGLQETIILVEGTTDYAFYFTANANSNAIYIKRNTSSGNYQFSIDNVSVKEIQTDVPRIDFTDDATGHLLLEPQSTNLIPHSEDFNNAWYFVNTADVELSNNISPEGIKNAYKITYGSGGNSLLGANFSLPNTQHTNSIYMRKISGSGVVNFKSPINNTNNVTLTDQWQRYSVTATLVDGTARLRVDLQTFGDVIEVFGAQQEELSYATSYIPTFGSTATRNAEVCNNSGSVQDFNSEEGVLYADIAALANDGTSRTISLSKDINDRIQMYFNTSDNSLKIFYRAQGTHTLGMTEILSDATEFNKIAFKWKTNDFALWVNGTETDTVSSGVTSNANTLNALEFEMFNDSGAFYGKTKNLKVFKRAMSDGELYLLTVPQYQSYQEMATALNYTL